VSVTYIYKKRDTNYEQPNPLGERQYTEMINNDQSIATVCLCCL